MPELPETETIARDLHDMIAGAVIGRVSVPRPDVLREGTAEALADAVIALTVARVWRRAKLIVLDLHARGEARASDAHGSDAPAADPPWRLVVQPRFTGGLIIDHGSLAASELAYVCVTLGLTDGRQLHYRDVRRLGTVTLMPPARFAAYSAALGVEPLDPTLTPAAFSGLVRLSRQPIKVWLMDQKRLAGVGNIYANEALWRAAIDPSRPANALSPHEASALLEALQAVLTASIAARGTSFRDYRDARGERGAFVAQLAAYGRADQPCQRCGKRLVGTHAVDGRSTVFCPHCQR